MKIIDLLNMISKGEEVPKYIQYYNMLKDKTDIMMVCKENIFYKLDQLEIQLNSRVEIIEEEKKIPEKLDMVLLGQCDNWLQPTIETDEKIRAELNPYVIDIIRENTLEIQHKFNELLDYLKSKGDE